jgi:hypothetical protein
MACHRSAVWVLAEAGGGDVERRNEELKESGLGCVGAAAMVAPLLRGYNDVERRVLSLVFLAVQVKNCSNT